MQIKFTDHANERMQRYELSQQVILSAIQTPDSIKESYGNRLVYQKRLNGYLLRVVVEEKEGIKTIVTLYKARSDRYEI
ncbi:DUF4258 domain-containing protein [Candidatus Micrarchaeota archaeon]|nr:DUF4258 domain-containing protein [Candidatus Micrarchaeota archaeon]